MNKYIFPVAALTGAVAGMAGVKWPFPLVAGIMAAVTCLAAPEVLGFFICGGLHLTGRTLSLGQEELFFLNMGSFIFPLYCLLLLLLLRRRAGALAAVLGCWEFWAVLGLGLLMLARLPDSLFAEYGVRKVKYYLANNMAGFFGPVLATAVWGGEGLRRFLRGAFLGGLALTAYFWLSKSYLDLTLNTYAVLNFNPIGLGRLIGLFALLAVFWRMLPLPVLFRIPLAAAAAAAVVMLNARGPALALAAGLLAGGLLPAGSRFGRLPLLAVPAFLLLAALISSSYWFSPGFFSVDDTGRLSLYRAALEAFFQNPLPGAGTGSYAWLAPAPGVLYPHNLFLEAAVELGLPGLGLAMLLVFAPLARLALWKNRAEEGALSGALLVFCLVNAMLSGDIPGNFPLWISTGVAVSLAMARGEERR